MGKREPPVAASPFASPVLMPIVTAIGTTHAFEIGTLLVTLHDLVLGDDPSPKKYQVEAGLLTIAIALVLVLLVKLRVALAKDDEEALRDCAGLVVVAIIGGFFAILSKTQDAADASGDQTGRSLYFFLVISVILLTPFVSATWDASGLHRFGQVYRSMMQTTLVALVVTGSQQFIFEYANLLPLGTLNVSLASGGADFASTGFYLSAPMVAALFAPWAFLTVQPVIRPDHWNIVPPKLWIAGYLFLGLLLIAGFVKLIYLAGPEPRAWLAHLGEAEQFYFAYLAFLLLQAPLLVIPVFSVLFLQGRWPDWTLVAISLGIGALCSWALADGKILPVSLRYNSAQLSAFLLAHAAAAGATTFAVLRTRLK